MMLLGKKYKILIFGLIAISLIVWGCSKGYFWSQRFYFPAGSLPEDNWSAVVIVNLECPRRVIDVDEKRYSIKIKNKKGDDLYAEIGKVLVGEVDASVQWLSENSLTLVLKNIDGKVMLVRKMEYDSSLRVYKLSK